MDKSVHVVFEVQPVALQKTEGMISQFVKRIRRNVPETRMYSSFREASNPCRFTHVMIFDSYAARQLHKSSACVNGIYGWIISHLYPGATVHRDGSLYLEMIPLYFNNLNYNHESNLERPTISGKR